MKFEQRTLKERLGLVLALRLPFPHASWILLSLY